MYYSAIVKETCAAVYHDIYSVFEQAFRETISRQLGFMDSNTVPMQMPQVFYRCVRDNFFDGHVSFETKDLYCLPCCRSAEKLPRLIVMGSFKTVVLDTLAGRLGSRG